MHTDEQRTTQPAEPVIRPLSQDEATTLSNPDGNPSGD